MQTIEAETGQKVCVVYGALPPEMRRIQARLFNDADTEYKVRSGRQLHLHARLGMPPPPFARVHTEGAADHPCL